MNIIFLDFETYYDREYSLRRMTPAEYILDPRFEVIGCAVKEPGKPRRFLEDAELRSFFASLDAQNVMLVSHNALFDMCIVAWHYGFVPKLMCCTMSVARAMLGSVLKSVSLASVAKHLGLGAKGNTVAAVMGMGAAAIKAAGMWDAIVEYALNDCELCEGIFEQLVASGKFPHAELVVMDHVIRCAVEPKFKLDQNVLCAHLAEVKATKEQLMAQAMLVGADSKSALMSNEQFAALLRNVGVEPPMKTSPTTGLETYAFAKTDVAFLALEEHENPAVQALVGARLGHRSTLEESRCQRMLDISRLTWRSNGHLSGQCHALPMPLGYSRAHTHRLGGEWKINVQNLPRGGALRRALIPLKPGHTVLTIDAKQIEAREVATISGQWDLVREFENGDDTYANFASVVFGFPVNKKDHPTERFVGKQGVLGLGYGLGWVKFQARLKTDSKNQTGTMISLSDEAAQRVVNTYRAKYQLIPLAWRKLNNLIPLLAGVGDTQEAFGPVLFERGSVLLPSGLRLFYHDLKYVDGEWLFTYGGVPKRLYGGKLMENICQALARIIVFEAEVRITARFAQLGIEGMASQAHDEIIYVVPNDILDTAEAIALEEMRRRPVWWPEVPVDGEIGKGASYGDAK